MINKLALIFLFSCALIKVKAQKGAMLLFLDGKEISFADLVKMEPGIISKYEYVKANEAVKTYNTKGRFGIMKLTSNKKPVIYTAVSYKTTLYFIPDTSNSFVHVADYMDNDLKKMFSRMEADHPGCSLTIDNLAYYDKSGKAGNLQNEMSFFNLSHFNGSYDSISAQLAELIFYSVKPFISGTIYFSGTYFPNVVIVFKNDFVSLQKHFQRCAAGSIINFDNCIYKNPDGSLSKPLTKTIKLE
jgi:hypothetical protein